MKFKNIFPMSSYKLNFRSNQNFFDMFQCTFYICSQILPPHLAHSAQPGRKQPHEPAQQSGSSFQT